MIQKGRGAPGLLLLALAGLCAAQTPLRDAKVMESVPVDKAIHGLAVSEGNMWSFDAVSGALLSFRSGQRTAMKKLAVRVAKPKAVAWDGKTFWCAGAEPNRVYQVDAASGAVLKTLEIETPKTVSPVSLDSLAWDGKALWVGHSAGWSSRISRVDVASGRVTLSFFSEGVPRALAADGNHVWMASYNGGELPSLLSQWTIGADAKQISRTRRFLARLPGKDPVGLARDGQTFWYADRTLKSFQRVQLPEER